MNLLFAFRIDQMLWKRIINLKSFFLNQNCLLSFPKWITVQLFILIRTSIVFNFILNANQYFTLYTHLPPYLVKWPLENISFPLPNLVISAYKAGM